VIPSYCLHRISVKNWERKDWSIQFVCCKGIERETHYWNSLFSKNFLNVGVEKSISDGFTRIKKLLGIRSGN